MFGASPYLSSLVRRGAIFPDSSIAFIGSEDLFDPSDLIARLSGKAYWRKLFVRTDVASVDEARSICAELIASGGQPRLW